mmetsp:Transcript_61374/g.71741  ORF Transcript_61374/g.71741 Transcript_61374/m.71741 type:complete len:268 (+) Transcript_61374:63-866(+)|eukprot:CAMPEP_0194367806 /NCGR_PEP_ID=MMETSP0174-20130528/15975_1 /TAXON_ID=216777 /ORGANISM="Proboscia alata, Strain PI-D3" /LENGTH=267 /DNA_ID=CAMNT_0039143823 /DNA_START=55 /DNA_END=858 /DNA_ORIENTATION=-
MEETIYNLVPIPKRAHAKESMYRSKYDPKAPLIGSTFGLHGTNVTVGKGINELKKTCVISSTFGPTEKNRPSPSKFLRKGSRKSIKVGADKNNSDQCRNSKENLKPSVPLRNDKPIMGLMMQKDFVKTNAVEVILSDPPNTYEDDGNFMDRSCYGKVPEYIGKVKEELRQETELIDKYVSEELDGINQHKQQHADCEVIGDDERDNLKQQLKRKWDEVNRKYQKICHRTTMDTLGDIKRKEAREKELRQLEDDILLLSRQGPIMIKN